MVGYGTRQYKKTEITTADRGRLIVLLYEGAIGFLVRAKDALFRGDYEARCNLINRAQDIITELNSSLNMNEGGEIAANLRRLYNFMNTHLVKAKIKDDPALLDQVMGMLADLNTAWTEIASRPEVVQAAQNAGPAPKAETKSIRV